MGSGPFRRSTSGDPAFASPNPVRFREYLYPLVQRCSMQGISVYMTMEVPDLFHLQRLSEWGVSNLSDNFVLLQYLRGESQIKRAVGQHRGEQPALERPRDAGEPLVA